MSPQSKNVEGIDTQHKRQEISQISKDLGSKIQQARTSMKKTLQEVSDTLKIQTKYLKAIEAGESSNMPSVFYYLSFIKSYIRYLKLDTENLYDELKSHYKQVNIYTGNSFRVLTQSRYNRQSINLLLNFGILIFIVITFTVFYLLYRQSSNENVEQVIVDSSYTHAGTQVTIVAAKKTYIKLSNSFNKVIFSGYIGENETKIFYSKTGMIMKTDNAKNITVFVNGTLLSNLINKTDHEFIILRGPKMVKTE